jgi:tetratricopeptide (TPR) repeat protein
MNRIYFIFFLIWAAAIGSCGTFDKKSTGNSEELLGKPPFQAISDSIRQFPNNPELRLHRASLLSENNQHELAYSDYKKCWELTPSEAIAPLYASNLFLTGRTTAAIDFLKKCIQQYPNNLELMRRLGEAYSNSGKTKEAIGLYDNLLKQDSNNFDALYEKGVLLTKTKDTNTAISILEKSYRLQPLMQSGLALADLYAETKNEKAIDLCNALEQRDTAKEFIDPVFLKGIYFSNIKDYPKAISLFDECINRNWKFIEPYLEKGIIFYRQRNYDEAIKTFQLALTVSYTNADAYYWIGRCCEDIGKKEEALDYYYKALSFDKNLAEAEEGIKRLHG